MSPKRIRSKGPVAPLMPIIRRRRFLKTNDEAAQLIYGLLLQYFFEYQRALVLAILRTNPYACNDSLNSPLKLSPIPSNDNYET